jgi:DNA modification methylase
MRAPHLDDGDVRIWHGDAIEQLDQMPEGTAQTCVTSPPYWGLRDYGTKGQLGLESTPDEYVGRMVDVFRSVRRVLRNDGTLWLNLGDSYAGSGPNRQGEAVGASGETNGAEIDTRNGLEGLKPKDLVGIPWRVAFALQADGWYLRSDIIWAKPNPMPESVTDRPTKSHEYVFLLSKSARYYYDAEAIKESAVTAEWPGIGPGHGETRNRGEKYEAMSAHAGRNARSVWRIATKPYAEAHFATFPVELPERCIKAGSRERDTVLDPFMGSGTTAWVARHLGRKAIGCELNADYIGIAARRLQQLSLMS